MTEGEAFEERVRKVARSVWSDALYNGRDSIKGREHDARIESVDQIIFIECTISAKADKVRSDCQKLTRIVRDTKRATHKHCRGIIVTKDTPTQHQIDAVRSAPVALELYSFDQLYGMIFNRSEYTALRSAARFGSIQNLKDDSISVARRDFVHPTMIFQDDESDLLINDVVGQLLRKKRMRVALLADYGSGKSMILRETFLQLSEHVGIDDYDRCCLHLNLRDHLGQQDPGEALLRHGRSIGYPKPDQLIKVWRSGMCDLLLDGFDELNTVGWSSQLARAKAHRRMAMTLVRNFVAEADANTSIIIAGRDNFFDTHEEMAEVLGLRAGAFRVAEVLRFNETQVKEYLSKLGISSDIPQWIPSKPLLIGYLALEGFIDGVHSDVTPPQGWDMLLDKISQREAKQDHRLEPPLVRELLERLATIARSSKDGLGAFSLAETRRVFQDVVGFEPDEGSQQILLRLPGLRPSEIGDGTRSFVDSEFTNALRAGDLIRLVQNPYSHQNIIDLMNNADAALGHMTSALLATKIMPKITLKQLSAAAKILSELECHSAHNELLLSLLYAMSDIEETHVEISEFELDEIFLSDLDYDRSMVRFSDGIIHSMHFDPTCDRSLLPKFERCIISRVIGARTREELSEFCTSCTLSELEKSGETTDTILDSRLPVPIRVLLTVLRKLYMQKGGGRKVAALYRGLDTHSRQYVDDVIQLLISEGFVQRSRSDAILLPVRTLTGRVRKIMADPLGTREAIVSKAQQIH